MKEKGLLSEQRRITALSAAITCLISVPYVDITTGRVDLDLGIFFSMTNVLVLKSSLLRLFFRQQQSYSVHNGNQE